MVFDFTDEQRALRSAVAAFADAVSPESELRRVMSLPSGYDLTVWARMADELGLQGLAIPEEYGGSGAGLVELAIVFDELGRRLVPGPLLSTVLAGLAITYSGEGSQLAEIAAGQTIATVAVAEDDGIWAADGVHCLASADDADWVLSGAKRFVPDGQVAHLIVVAARTAEGVGLFAVAADAVGVTVNSLTGFDLTRRLADITFDGVRARRLGGADLFERLLDAARVLVAAEQAGGAAAALDMTVAYAKDRVQFGRAIGSFQAIKHMCADTLLDVESARSAAYYAAWAMSEEHVDAAAAAPLAKAFCSDTFFAAASVNMQVHGGISFTWEHPAHLYYRRAKSGVQMWGNSRAHRELLATRMGL